MVQTVVLVPLVCPNCAAPVPAEPDQVAWVCQVCGQGMHLDDRNGLERIQVNYSSSVPVNATGKPYWVAQGQVTLQRESFGSSKNQQAEEFWGQARQFFVPAYLASLEELLTIAKQLLLSPPKFQAGSPVRFEPVVLDIRDVSSAAEFIMVAIEADRPDRLKEINFNLKLSRPSLWILP